MAFLVWALLACSGVYWALQAFTHPLATPALARQAGGSGPLRGDWSRLLGVTPAEAAPLASSRYQLLGVVAPKTEAARQAGEGVALIAVDGIARTVRVGAEVDSGLHLIAVDADSATLGGDSQASIHLPLPAPTAPSVGAPPVAAPSNTVLGGAALPSELMPPPGQYVPQGQVTQPMAPLAPANPLPQGEPGRPVNR